MNKKLFEALDELEATKGISKEVMTAKVIEAITRACQKEFGGKNLAGQNSDAVIEVTVDEKKKELKVYLVKTVVAELTDPVTEILLPDARKYNKRITVGKQLRIEINPSAIQRNSAKIAKNTIIQCIREAENDSAKRAYENKKEEIVTATIRFMDRNTHALILESDTGMLSLPETDQLRDDIYRPGAKLKVYVRKIYRQDGDVDVRVSRTDPNFIRGLFKLEIPEIADGTVEIKHVAREAGSRTKISVLSNDGSLDPVGACIGPRGMRISAILDEISGEKIDIIPFSEDPVEYVSAALAPAKVIRVELESEKVARVFVPADQLSLAIGREGQNARLAVRLTGCKIDIKTE